MGGHKKDKKHKKKHKKDKKKKSKRRSSTSESSSEEDLWVEKSEGSSERESSPPLQSQPKRDDWLSNADDLFATVSKEKLKPKIEKKKEERISIDEMGQSSRELNPYWKDGGSGLPEEASAYTQDKLSGTVGDLGLGWLRRALDRAKQTATEEKRSLEDVVAPVWGSLEKLLGLIKEAEDKANKKSQHRYEVSRPSRPDERFRSHRTFHKPDDDDVMSYRRHEKDDDRPRGFRKPSHIDDDRPRGFKRPSDIDDVSSRDNDRSRDFKKPSDHDDKQREWERRNYRSSNFRKSREDESKDRLDKLRTERNTHRLHWKKPNSNSEPSVSGLRHEPEARKAHSSQSIKESSPLPEQDQQDNEIPQPQQEPEVVEKPEIITQDEMNKMAAEILRAEMFGNKDEVQELKARLKRAQAWLAGRGSTSKNSEPKEVILTQTDRRGFTQPVSSSSSSQPHSKKRIKVETHKDGKRVKYFADDDRYSLQDLVQQEKFISVSEQNEMYAKLAKGIGQKMEDDDFEEGGGRDKSDEWADFGRRQKAALDSTKREKILDSCRFCLDSATSNRKLVISLMDKVYLSVPPYQSLTEGHCLIMPIQHTPCATLIDEDVWEEIMDLRRLVVKMFLEEDKDVIFYESAKNLNKFPHMVLNCVPVPKETGDDAPIYFKKALLECEMEWSNNKKVVDLKGRDIRKGVPKGLSYFWVDFGLQSGYAHVIEDERLFPRNFAEEVIGGMMDMDHSIWRKQKKDDQKVQIAKTQQFIKKFKEFTSKKQF